MTLSSSDITSIVRALQESDWDEALVVIDDVQISVARNGARLSGVPPVAVEKPRVSAQEPDVPIEVVSPVATTAAPADTAPAAPLSDTTDFVITAPSVGVVWRSSEPGAAAFLEIGNRVRPEDTACIVEIMKLMNNVAVGVAGLVTAVHVENGQAVEFGAPLFSIRVDAS